MAEAFEDLEVWKRGARLSAGIDRGLRALRDWGFRDQSTRSGLSIPSNIAEGHEREFHRDRINFFPYATGSVGELRTTIDIGDIDRQTRKQGLTEAQQISRMLGSSMKARKSITP